MTNSKYEKYVIRNAMRLEILHRKEAESIGNNPPLTFMNGDKPIKGSNQYFDCGWMWAAPPPNIKQHLTQHVHDFDEIFGYFGNRPDDPTYLGAEIGIWLGKDKDKELILFNTSTIIFIPKGLWHLPIVYNKFDSPVFHIMVGINTGLQYKATLDNGEVFSY